MEYKEHSPIELDKAIEGKNKAESEAKEKWQYAAKNGPYYEQFAETAQKSADAAKKIATGLMDWAHLDAHIFDKKLDLIRQQKDSDHEEAKALNAEYDAIRKKIEEDVARLSESAAKFEEDANTLAGNRAQLKEFEDKLNAKLDQGVES